MEVSGEIGGVDELLLHRWGFVVVDDEEADKDVVVYDEMFCKLQEGNEVAYARAWEEGNVRFCYLFSTHH